MITASQLELLLVCPGQAVLECYGSSSDAAVAGTRAHEELIPAAVDGTLPDTPQGEALRRFAVPPDAACEVPVAIDLDRFKARLLRSSGRSYSDAQPGEIVGTADWLSTGLRHGAHWVGELKTGAAPVTPARWNSQLWFFGLALLLMRGAGAHIALALAQVTGKGELRASYCEPTTAQLWAFFDRLVGLRNHVREQTARNQSGERLALVRGPHCRYCNAVATCPAVSEVVGDGNAGEAYQRAAAELARAEVAERQARALLVAAEYELPGGARLVRREKWTRRIDARRAIDAMPELEAAAVRKEVVSLRVRDVDAYAEEHGVERSKRARREELSRKLTSVGALAHTMAETFEVVP